jgi:hypothetical protein
MREFHAEHGLTQTPYRLAEQLANPPRIVSKSGQLIFALAETSAQPSAFMLLMHIRRYD